MATGENQNSKDINLEMVEWSCTQCGCVQMMPKEFNDKLRQNHQTFWCMNGHGNLYNTKTTNEELELKLMNEYAKNVQLENEIRKLKKSFINRLLPPK